MIFLDTPNLSIILATASSSTVTISSSVSYWSVSTSNVWTPRTFAAGVVGAPGGQYVMLPQPNSGESARVVENAWFSFTVVAGSSQVAVEVGNSSTGVFLAVLAPFATSGPSRYVILKDGTITTAPSAVSV